MQVSDLTTRSCFWGNLWISISVFIDDEIRVYGFIPMFSLIGRYISMERVATVLREESNIFHKNVKLTYQTARCQNA